MNKLIKLAIISLVLLPMIGYASFDTSLKYGSKGDNVINLQDFLQEQGLYTGKLDGRYGFGTMSAVKAFQTTNGLKADGYFGKASRAKADEIMASLLADSNATEQEETGTISDPTITPTPLPVTITNLPNSIVNNTPTNQPIINLTPQSMKDIQVENLTQGDVKYFDSETSKYGVFNFKVTVLDDNGNPITNANLSMNVDNAGSSSYFAGNGETSFYPNRTGEFKLTFSYTPLNLSKTLTVTVK